MSDPLESLLLGLPYLAPSHAQKHATHNEALRTLDAIVQLAVLDANRTAPPDEPGEGDRHIVADGATGVWAGRDGAVAVFIDGAWAYASPQPGWLAYDRDAGAILVFTEGEWQAAVSGGSVAPAMLGINSTLNTTNRLAVRSEAVPFSGIEDSVGGSGDIRFLVNT